MLASPSLEVGRVQHENAPSGVERAHRHRPRDFRRFDHASEEAIPNTATTTPIVPMIASVDMRSSRVSRPVVDFWYIVPLFEDVGTAQTVTKKVTDDIRTRRSRCEHM